MLSSKQFLSKCEKLKQRGFFKELEPGIKLGRAYADLGYEEFILLPGGRLVSLLTGEKSLFPEGHQEHFFCIPGIQDLVDALDRLHVDVESILYENQRRWLITLKQVERDTTLRFVDKELEVVLANALLTIAESQG